MSEQKVKRKILWHNYQEIAYIPKGPKQRICVAAGIRNGVKCINLREFYWNGKNGEWRPGREGISIPVEIPIPKPGQEPPMVLVETLKKLLEAIGITVKHLEKMELYDEAKAIWYYPKPKEDKTNKEEDTHGNSQD